MISNYPPGFRESDYPWIFGEEDEAPQNSHETDEDDYQQDFSWRTREFDNQE